VRARGGWLAALLIAARPACPAAAAPPAAPLPVLAAPGAHDRLLIVAPHPDDETLCCAGLIAQALRAHAAVAIVWLTAGDGFELDALLVEHALWPSGARMRQLGRERLEEAHRAADRLGVARAAQYALGYPDRGLEPLLGSAGIYRSPYTERSAVFYAGTLHPGAAYTRANLERDLQAVLEAQRPTLVFSAAPEDRHPDHSASGTLLQRLLAQRAADARLYFWIVHAPHWPRPLGLHPQLALGPPASAADRRWLVLPLSPQDRTLKLEALRAHRSQLSYMAPFLEAFVRADELFAR